MSISSVSLRNTGGMPNVDMHVAGPVLNGRCQDCLDIHHIRILSVSLGVPGSVNPGSQQILRSRSVRRPRSREVLPPRWSGPSGPFFMPSSNNESRPLSWKARRMLATDESLLMMSRNLSSTTSISKMPTRPDVPGASAGITAGTVDEVLGRWPLPARRIGVDDPGPYRARRISSRSFEPAAGPRRR